MFQRLLYVSRATDDVNLRDVYDIIRIAHNRNANNGLTGGLLFLDGYFLQVLEGSPYAVEERYSRILADPRHTDVSLRLNESSSNLLFPSEWMALRSKTDLPPRLFAVDRYQPGLPIERFDAEQVLHSWSIALRRRIRRKPAGENLQRSLVDLRLCPQDSPAGGAAGLRRNHSTVMSRLSLCPANSGAYMHWMFA